MDTAARKNKTDAEEKKTLSHRIADFLRKNRVALLALLAAVLAAVVAVAVWTAIYSASQKASTTLMEKVEGDIATWQSEQDLAKKAELEKAIVAELDKVIASWPRLFAAQRAHAAKAKLAEERKDWAAAEKEWIAAVEVGKDGYLAPIALQHAAVAAEERGAPEKATEHYKRLVESYTGKTAGIAHAHFALGRLSEDAKDYAAALASYEKVVSSFPDEDWTKLAKDRILFIRSRGLAK